VLIVCQINQNEICQTKNCEQSQCKLSIKVIEVSAPFAQTSQKVNLSFNDDGLMFQMKWSDVSNEMTCVQLRRQVQRDFKLSKEELFGLIPFLDKATLKGTVISQNEPFLMPNQSQIFFVKSRD
jgi:hypothetical protein